jgi:hypothetical protein
LDKQILVENLELTSSPNGLLPDVTREVVDVTSGLPSLSFSAPAEMNTLAVHFVAALQKVLEADLEPFTKTITPLYETGMIDFPGKTIASNSTEDPHLFAIASSLNSEQIVINQAILDDLTFEIDLNAKGIARYAKISGTWRGRKIGFDQAFEESTFSVVDDPEFYNSEWTFKINGGDALPIKKYTLSIKNNFTTDSRGAGGIANNYLLNPEITVTVQLPYRNSETYDLSIESGEEYTFTMEHGTDGVSGHVLITTKGLIVNNDSLNPDGNYVSVNLNQRVHRPGSGSGCTVVISDSIDRGYPAAIP